MKRALAFLAGVCLAAAQAYAGPTVDAVDRIVIPVSDLSRAANFYTGALSFVPVDAAEPPGMALRLGEETIELVPHTGRLLPRDSRSNDRWFQHLAIVVSDIDRAYAIVFRQGAAPISQGIQELPAWNPNAGGIRAVYFRDPDGHPLELIQFPPGKGDPRWQQNDLLFLGIDHSAIAVQDTETRLALSRPIGPACRRNQRELGHRAGTTVFGARRPCADHELARASWAWGRVPSIPVAQGRPPGPA